MRIFARWWNRQLFAGNIAARLTCRQQACGTHFIATGAWRKASDRPAETKDMFTKAQEIAAPPAASGRGGVTNSPIATGSRSCSPGGSGPFALRMRLSPRLKHSDVRQRSQARRLRGPLGNC